MTADAVKPDAWLAPPDPPSRPRYPAPAGAIDSHAHVFGPLARYPLAPGASYRTPDLPVAAYLAMLARIGFARGVLVQPSAYALDNGALLAALAAAPERLRGIAVAKASITDGELAAWQAAGVRGLRFSQFAAGGAHGFSGTVGFEDFTDLAPRLRALGWQAQIWTRAELFAAAAERLLAPGVPLVLDHMGHFDPRAGLNDASFRLVLRLLGEGRIWVKLPVYRNSQAFPDYEDCRPFHDALVRANPERLVWGTDWPHVGLKRDMPDVGRLVDLFAAWVEGDGLRRKILVENPARLYGFTP